MDPIKAYLKDVRPIPLLSAEDEINLARKIRKGDSKARETMIRSNLRLVISIAKRYVNLGVSLSDLIEEGNIGLMKSVMKFDPDKGFRFSTYAAWWIKQSISRAIVDQGKLIRVPVYMNEEIFKYKKAIEGLTHKLKRKPSAGDIAKKLKVSAEKVREWENAIAKMSSLDAPIGEEGDGQVKDMIEDENLVGPDEQVEIFMNKERTTELLEMLDEREKKVINMRFGLLDGNAHTLAEIADELGVSRERIRQIEEATLKKIRHIIRNQKRGLGSESNKILKNFEEKEKPGKKSKPKKKERKIKKTTKKK
ncbi:MAG: RNA polymerase sigma factor RpoD/SigA [Candidatus Omnitrophota bacterium]